MAAKEPAEEESGKPGCEEYKAKDFPKYEEKCGNSNIAQILEKYDSSTDLSMAEVADEVDKKKCAKWAEYYVASEVNGCF